MSSFSQATVEGALDYLRTCCPHVRLGSLERFEHRAEFLLRDLGRAITIRAITSTEQREFMLSGEAGIRWLVRTVLAYAQLIEIWEGRHAVVWS